MIKLSQSWPVGTPSNWLHVHMTCVHHSLKTSFLSSTRYSRFILNVSALSCNQPFLQEAGVPFQLKKMVFRSQDLGMRCAHFNWGIATIAAPRYLPSLRTELRNPCMYVCLYIYVCVLHLYYIYIYQYLLKSMSSQQYF